MQAPSIVTSRPTPVYGPAEAARALGVSVSYIERLRRNGVARPTVPMGSSGRLIFSHADLRRLAAAIGRTITDEPEAA